MLALLRTTPDSPPAYFRLRLDLLEFTPPVERTSTGRSWQSTPLPAYTNEGSLQP